MTDEPQPTPPASEPPSTEPPSTEPTPPAQPPAVAPPPAPASRPSRRRTYVVIGAIVVFLGIVLFAVRNNQSASDLAVGTCFDRPAGSSISTVEKHGCTEPHDA